MDVNLRYGGSYAASAWEPVFKPAASQQMTPEGYLIDAIEQCNGAGVCRKTDGVMCPSFQASQEEMHSTRGRANLLRAMISGRFASTDLAEQNVREALDLCLACKGCKSECPSGVDIAKLKYEFFQYYYDQPGHRRPLRDFLFGYFDEVSKFGYFFRPIANLILQSNWFSFLGDWLLGVAAERKLPEYAGSGSLQSQWRRYHSRRPAQTANERVLFLSDAFTEYFHPNAGLAALKLLLNSGCEATLLPVLGTGRTLISKGFLSAAKVHAERLIRTIRKIDPDGAAPIVGVEPSEIYTLRDEYLEFFPDDPFVKDLSRRAWMIDEFLLRPGISGNPRIRTIEKNGGANERTVLLHGHCYQKAQPPSADGLPNGVQASVSFLKAFGFVVRVIDAGCCGMAGAFGYEKAHYSFSQRVGELALFPTLREEIASDQSILVAASGVSCQAQIHDGVGRVSIHPAELAASLLDQAGNQGE